MFGLSLFWEYRVILWHGLLINLLVFVLSSALGLIVGLFACIARLSNRSLLRKTAAFYVEVIRSAPELVLLFWIYSVVPVLLSELSGTRITLDPIVAATLALGLVSSGYFAETFRAGIQAVPAGHVEAAQALGMSTPSIYRRIVLPQAIHLMLPELMSQNIGLLKTTTLVSVITVPDIVYQINLIVQQEMQPLPLYTGTAIAFFVLILALTSLIGRSGNRLRPA
jgi:polar amino acid transport system permease protein